MSSGATMPRRLFKTIGARLTVWGACLTLAVCALWGLVLYAGLFLSLRAVIDTLLQGEVHEFMVTLQEHPDNYAKLERTIRRELGARKRHDLAFRLFEENGRLAASSESNDAIAPLWAAPTDWIRKPPHFRFDTVHASQQPYPVRTCSIRVVLPDGSSATAQASYVLDRMTMSLAFYRRMSIIALGLAAILAALAGRLMAHRSLQPVQSLTDAAERIGADHLEERIPLAGTGDELDRLAITLNKMLDRIERHVRRMQQFTADASHELRTPLTALRGSAEVALSRPHSAAALRKVLEEGIEQYERLSRIAEDLLFLARADAGYGLADRQAFRLDEAVAKVVDLYAPLAQERGVDLIFGRCVAISIVADDARLRQLVGNLIDNAVKFTKPGDQIHISLTNGDGVATITIADTGQGIAAEHLPYVFDRFYRADQARSSKSGGAGLGLAICRAIAVAHGGKIDVHSTPGDGTVFIVTMPVDPTADGAIIGGHAFTPQVRKLHAS